MPYFPNDGSAQYMHPVNHDYSYGQNYLNQPGQNPYPAYDNINAAGYGLMQPDPYDSYKNGPAHMPGYDHNAAYVQSQRLMAPYMPPLRMQDGWSGQVSYHQHQLAQREKDEKPVGGVSAKLDYEMEQMTDFLSEMTVGMYELLASRICIADIDLMRSIKPGTVYPPAFRAWVKSMLNATRLPSATIVLSLSYMAMRVRHLSDAGTFQPSERSLQQMLTVALILGSKFLDDNTFQNKSWAEVSHITVQELNQDERDWLASFNHRLHFDPDRPSGFNCWQAQWSSFRSRTAKSSASLVPIDTNVRRQRSIPSGMSSVSYDQFYSKPAYPGLSVDTSFHEANYPQNPYSAYDGWYNGRSSNDRSPPTAPHSGPHTPEYYGQQHMWGGYDAFAHRQQYALPAISAYAHPQPQQGGWNLPSFASVGPIGPIWSGHASGCHCSSCRVAMSSRYGSVMAA